MQATKDTLTFQLTPFGMIFFRELFEGQSHSLETYSEWLENEKAFQLLLHE